MAALPAAAVAFAVAPAVVAPAVVALAAAAVAAPVAVAAAPVAHFLELFFQDEPFLFKNIKMVGCRKVILNLKCLREATPSCHRNQ